jgi:uncharacterized coiled-coil protein SlyX
MESNYTAIIISIIALIGGVTPSIVMYIKDSRRTASENERDKGEHDKSITEAAVALVEPLKDRIKELEARVGNQDIVINDQEKRIRALTAEVDCWKDGAERLVNQLKSHKIQPVWEPIKEVK